MAVELFLSTGIDYRGFIGCNAHYRTVSPMEIDNIVMPGHVEISISAPQSSDLADEGARYPRERMKEKPVYQKASNHRVRTSDKFTVIE
jgi:hypothetical protein